MSERFFAAAALCALAVWIPWFVWVTVSGILARRRERKLWDRIEAATEKLFDGEERK